MPGQNRSLEFPRHGHPIYVGPDTVGLLVPEHEREPPDPCHLKAQSFSIYIWNISSRGAATLSIHHQEMRPFEGIIDDVIVVHDPTRVASAQALIDKAHDDIIFPDVVNLLHRDMDRIGHGREYLGGVQGQFGVPKLADIPWDRIMLTHDSSLSHSHEMQVDETPAGTERTRAKRMNRLDPPSL
jgi:hypothetical protein